MAKKTWERVTFTIDSDSLTRAERIKHVVISYTAKKNRRGEIEYAAARAIQTHTPLEIDVNGGTVFQYTSGSKTQLNPIATFTCTQIEEPKPQTEEDLFDLKDAA